MPEHVNGVFSFSLKERRDRRGNMYLVGGIRFVNGVLFVRPTGASGPNGEPIWAAVLKPYTGQQPQQETEEFAWDEEIPAKKRSDR